MSPAILPPLRVGLTGGIASGKSTVAAMFAELGAHVIDADEQAHRALEPGGAAYAAVVERFGREILDAAGRIVRARLGQRVFGDPAALAELNAIVHPRVRAAAAAEFERCAREGLSWLAIYDAALLVETGAWRELDRLVVASCSRETQIRRLYERDGMTEAAAAARIDAQLPLEDKLDVADYVIDTDDGLERTRTQVTRVHAALRDDHARLHTPDPD